MVNHDLTPMKPKAHQGSLRPPGDTWEAARVAGLGKVVKPREMVGY